jgi:hypothetical protein
MSVSGNTLTCCAAIPAVGKGAVGAGVTVAAWPPHAALHSATPPRARSK